MLTIQHRCWRNGGIGEKAENWQDMSDGEPIFKGKNMGNMRGVRFGEFLALFSLATDKFGAQLLIIGM